MYSCAFINILQVLTPIVVDILTNFETGGGQVSGSVVYTNTQSDSTDTLNFQRIRFINASRASPCLD